MKNQIVVLIIFFLFTLMSCNEEIEEDKAPALRKLLINNKWQLLKRKFATDTDFVFSISYYAHVYSFRDDGRYVVKYPSFLDTVYVEGEWSVQSKPLVVDFINHDKIYKSDGGTVPLLLGTPTDWSIVKSDSTQLEIEGIEGDSLLGYYMVLRKLN